MSVRVVSFALIALVGCNPYSGRYVYSLTDVQHESRENGGAETEILKDEARNFYENEDFIISWKVLSDRFSFALVNKRAYSLKILWDEAAYVDSEGRTHRVMHGGVTFDDRNRAQVPSIVARESSFEDVMIPADNVTWVSMGKYSSWNVSDLFEIAPASSYAQLTAFMRPNLGKTVKVLLPVESRGQKTEYTYCFVVSGLNVPTRSE
jgi:hypothetical protein